MILQCTFGKCRSFCFLDFARVAWREKCAERAKENCPQITGVQAGFSLRASCATSQHPSQGVASTQPPIDLRRGAARDAYQWLKHGGSGIECTLRDMVDKQLMSLVPPVHHVFSLRCRHGQQDVSGPGG